MTDYGAKTTANHFSSKKGATSCSFGSPSCKAKSVGRKRRIAAQSNTSGGFSYERVFEQGRPYLESLSVQSRNGSGRKSRYGYGASDGFEGDEEEDQLVRACDLIKNVCKNLGRIAVDL